MQDLISAWRGRFGTHPVHPRDLIEAAFGPEPDEALFNALLANIPTLAAAPQPRTLAAWLSSQENLTIDLAEGSLRFSRAGHRWHLLPAFRALSKHHDHEEALASA